MARRNRREGPARAGSATVGHEVDLWPMADALRGSIDAGENRRRVLGLILREYISHASGEHRARVEAERASGADPEDPDGCRANTISWVPDVARWSHVGQVAHGDTFCNHRFSGLRADFIQAHQPFHASDWRGDLLRQDRPGSRGLRVPHPERLARETT